MVLSWLLRGLLISKLIDAASVEIVLCFKIYIMQGWILRSAEHPCLTLKFLRILSISPCESLSLTVPYHTPLTLDRSYENALNI